jgi:hypothetical protein
MSFARVRALVVVGVLFVAASIFVVMALVKDTQKTAVGSGAACREGLVPANLQLPEEKNIKINVYNATTQQGLAERVAYDFENREFQVANKAKIQNANDPQKKKVESVAALRYGPKAVGSAWVLRAYFLGVEDDVVTSEFDLERKDDVVDVVIGNKFLKLGTVTEVNQSLAALGSPEAPPGTCDSSAR